MNWIESSAVRIFSGALVMALTLTLDRANAAEPTTSPATVPSTQSSDLEVREWVIFVADAGQAQASGRGVWPATLPPFMTSRRESAPAGSDNRPAPLGVIRFIGDVEREVPVDVLLTTGNGSEVEATWPKAQVRPGRILWSNVFTDEAAKTADLDAKHWMTALRETRSATIKSGPQAERFLMYDVALGYKSPLTLKTDKSGLIRATNSSAAPLTDVTFYKKQNGVWTRATVPTIAAKPGAAVTPTAKPGPASQPDADSAFDAEPNAQPAGRARAVLARIRRAPASSAAPVTVEESVATTAPATTSPATDAGNAEGDSRIAARAMLPTTRRGGIATTGPATTRPTTGPTSAPAVTVVEPGSVVTFTPAPGDEAAVVSPWKTALTDAGVLPGDIDTVVSILRERGLAERWMTVIYRLDPAELDRMLPLEIVPTPKKVIRVGLVIVRGLDPSINEEIDRLITQCGDPDYAKRKAATTDLIALGQPAKAKVEKAVNNSDVEISQRAEMILAEIEKQKK